MSPVQFLCFAVWLLVDWAEKNFSGIVVMKKQDVEHGQNKIKIIAYEHLFSYYSTKRILATYIVTDCIHKILTIYF